MKRHPLTALRLANFKAFGEAQSIPIKPITLIFGPNSAGKSTVLHSLALAHELHIVQRQGMGAMPDVHRTALGGSAVDLGGFMQYVHKSDTDRNVEWSCEFDLSPEVDIDGVPDWDPLRQVLHGHLRMTIKVEIGLKPRSVREEVEDREVRAQAESFRKLEEEFEGGTLKTDAEFESEARSWLQALRRAEKELEARHPIRNPAVKEIQVLLDGKRLFVAEHVSEEHDGLFSVFRLVEWNASHKLFLDALERIDDVDSETLLRAVEASVPRVKLTSRGLFVKLRAPGSGRMQRRASEAADSDDKLAKRVNLYWADVSELVDLISNELHGLLISTNYLGPLRSIPPRHSLPGADKGPDWQAAGGFAWERLLRDERVRDDVNSWLEKLGTQYHFVTRTLVSLENLEGALAGAMADKFPPPPHEQLAELQRKISDLKDQVAMEGQEKSKQQAQLDALMKRAREAIEQASSPEERATVSESWKQRIDQLRKKHVWEERKLEHDISNLIGGEAQRKAGDFIERMRRNSIPKLPQLALRDKRNHVEVSHRDVGVGVSQVIPVLVAALGSEQRILAMEQPELHLHPGLQAKLADVFIQSALGANGNTFVVETHSEHLILRLLRRIRETSEGRVEEGQIPIRPEDVCILYVSSDGSGSKVKQIEVRPDGGFIQRWPNGFFADREEELF